MRVSSWVLLCGAALGYGVYESAFAASAPFPLDLFRPFPAFLVMLVMLNRQTGAYVAAGLAGAMTDLMTAGPSSMVLARWLLVVCVLDALSESVVTNRSLFAAVMLVTAARLVDLFASLFGFVLFGWFMKSPWDVLGAGTWLGVYLSDLMSVGILFVAFTMFTRRFLVTVSANRPTAYEP